MPGLHLQRAKHWCWQKRSRSGTGLRSSGSDWKRMMLNSGLRKYLRLQTHLLRSEICFQKQKCFRNSELRFLLRISLQQNSRLRRETDSRKPAMQLRRQKRIALRKSVLNASRQQIPTGKQRKPWKWNQIAERIHLPDKRNSSRSAAGFPFRTEAVCFLRFQIPDLWILP